MLAHVTTSAIATALGISWVYASHIRVGAKRPHPRHWMKLAELVGFLATKRQTLQQSQLTFPSKSSVALPNFLDSGERGRLSYYRKLAYSLRAARSTGISGSPLPEREEILVGGLRFRAIPSHCVRTPEAELRQRTDRIVADHSWMIENFLKLRPRCDTVFRGQIWPKPGGKPG
jgi:hypothetical protein